MNTGGVIAVLLTLLGLGWLSVSTLLVTLRGGRGPADPPSSHARVDPAGFPVLPAPRGALHRRGPRPPRRRPGGPAPDGGSPRRGTVASGARAIGR